VAGECGRSEGGGGPLRGGASEPLVWCMVVLKWRRVTKRGAHYSFGHPSMAEDPAEIVTAPRARDISLITECRPPFDKYIPLVVVH